jgi:hypothetical protein
LAAASRRASFTAPEGEGDVAVGTPADVGAVVDTFAGGAVASVVAQPTSATSAALAVSTILRTPALDHIYRAVGATRTSVRQERDSDGRLSPSGPLGQPVGDLLAHLHYCNDAVSTGIIVVE